MNGTEWNELLDEFRALGGAADNVRLGEGQFGRGLFAIDPARPVKLHVPENLLVNLSDVVFESGILRVASYADVGARERRFFDYYQARFSWGGGGRAEIEGIFARAQLLAADLREELRVKYRCGDWFGDPSENAVEQRFLASRHIDYQGRMALMPVLDLINHGAGTTFECTKGITVAGTWNGEIIVHYCNTDSYGAFQAWGFPCEELTAFSIDLVGNIGQTRLHISREFGEAKSGDRPWVPHFSKRDGDGVLDFLLLGNRQYPRLCKGIFYRVMQDAGLTGFEEAFDTIQHVNRMHFLGLLETLESVDGPMVEALRRMARYQLQALSYCYGVRVV